MQSRIRYLAEPVAFSNGGEATLASKNPMFLVKNGKLCFIEAERQRIEEHFERLWSVL